MNGEGTLLVLSGIVGILPDTLDFRGFRFWARTEIELAPDPLSPDLASMAAGLVEAVRRAGAEGRTIGVKLDTMPVRGDRWRQYRVRFDPPRRRVTVTLGPVVTTGQVPVEDFAPVMAAPVTAALDFPIRLDYVADITVDIFDGPILDLVPGRDGRIAIEFLPWHRGASHSLLTAVALGLLGGVVFRSVGAALLLALAYASHILADQLGFLGSRLFWPVSKRRIPGLQRTHAMDRFWNFGMIWTALVLIYANLAVQTPGGGIVSRFQLLVLGAALPLGLIAGLRFWLGRKQR